MKWRLRRCEMLRIFLVSSCGFFLFPLSFAPLQLHLVAGRGTSMRFFALFLLRPGLIKVQVVASRDDHRAHGAVFVGTVDDFEVFCGTRGHPVPERGRAALAECLGEITGMPAYFNAERAYDPGRVVMPNSHVPHAHGPWPEQNGAVHGLGRDPLRRPMSEFGELPCNL